MKADVGSREDDFRDGSKVMRGKLGEEVSKSPHNGCALRDSCQGGEKGHRNLGTPSPSSPRPSTSDAGFPFAHLVLGRAGGKENLAGIEELRVGVSEGQHTALGELGGQLSAFQVQSFLLWKTDKPETSEAIGVRVPGEGSHPPTPDSIPASRRCSRGEEKRGGRGNNLDLGEVSPTRPGFKPFSCAGPLSLDPHPTNRCNCVPSLKIRRLRLRTHSWHAVVPHSDSNSAWVQLRDHEPIDWILRVLVV